MLLEKISEKNNLITVSHFNELSPKLESASYDTKKDGDIFWKFNEEITGSVWMEVNFIEPTEIFEIDYNIEYIPNESTYTDCIIKHSLDGMNWYDYEAGLVTITPKFLRLEFTEIKPGFCMDSLKIYGEEKYKMGNELISLTSKRYYPQRFFEKYKTIPTMVHNFLEMLECNQYHKTIKRFFKNDNCTIEVFLIFDEGDEGSGAINSYPINTVPINTGSATTYDGLGAVIINRIGGGGAFYNLTGRITDPIGNYSSIGLRFNSTVDCTEQGNQCSQIMNQSGVGSIAYNQCGAPSEIQYRWEFDDPFAANVTNNPTTLSVASYGEVIHSFTMLGYYNVKFVMEVDGIIISGNQYVEITPSPYVISGDYHAINGTKYIISGLTAWPEPTYDLPIIIRRDLNETESDARLIDNGDRTFTVVANAETEPCKIKIYDRFYDEFRYFNMTFEPTVPENALLDHENNPILDDEDDFILTN